MRISSCCCTVPRTIRRGSSMLFSMNAESGTWNARKIGKRSFHQLRVETTQIRTRQMISSRFTSASTLWLRNWGCTRRHFAASFTDMVLTNKKESLPTKMWEQIEHSESVNGWHISTWFMHFSKLRNVLISWSSLKRKRGNTQQTYALAKSDISMMLECTCQRKVGTRSTLWNHSLTSRSLGRSQPECRVRQDATSLLSNRLVTRAIILCTDRYNVWFATRQREATSSGSIWTRRRKHHAGQSGNRKDLTYPRTKNQQREALTFGRKFEYIVKTHRQEVYEIVESIDHRAC